MEELSLVISQPDEGKFLQKIGWNKEQIMNAVAEITKQYTGLTYTEEQMQDAKKDRATLNAMRKDISDRRIQVKKALMAPYEASFTIRGTKAQILSVKEFMIKNNIQFGKVEK